uniref:Uncharacterized protein n=1 Tax=Amphimedon queenslandica TaxID=400682 RepID=A0A1X7T816_AMPQE
FDPSSSYLISYYYLSAAMNGDCQSCTAVLVLVIFAILILLIVIVLLRRKPSVIKPTQVEDDTEGMLHLPGGNMRPMPYQ